MCNRNVDEIPCKQKPCLPPRGRCPTDGRQDANAELKGRPVLYTGVVWIGIVRRFLIPRSCSVCQTPNETKPPETSAPSAPKAVAHVQTVESPLDEPPLRRKKRPEPVPLITERPDETSDDPKAILLRKRGDGGDSTPSLLKTLVVQVNEASAMAAAQAHGITQDLGSILRDGQETTADVIETVRSKDGKNFRLAAISATGLVGYLAGLKRGIVTRLVYSATGATAMATICYPEDTKTYNRQGLTTVRQWIVLGLSLVHPGPQKPLGGGDTRINNNIHFIDNGETQTSNDIDPSQINSFITDNIIANIKQNIASVGQRIEEIKAKLKESVSNTVVNESTEENGSNSDYPEDSDSSKASPAENLSHLKSDQLENVSSNNDSNVMRDLTPHLVPYSPALPVPPKVNSSQSKSKIRSVKAEDVSKNLVEETTPIKRKGSSGHFQSNNDLTGGVNDEDDDYNMQDDVDDNMQDDDDNMQDDDDNIQDDDDDIEDFSGKTFVIPTGGLEEKLEGRQEHLKKPGYNKNDGRPLNKKLTVYYGNMPEEEKTSREKGYDDAYSNRGK